MQDTILFWGVDASLEEQIERLHIHFLASQVPTDVSHRKAHLDFPLKDLSCRILDRLTP